MSEWKKVKLGECCEITSSKRIFLSDYVPVGIPFYRSKEIAEMQKGESISDPLFISNDKYEEIKCKFGIPQKGDLLLTAIGATLGIPFVIKNNLPFYFKDGNLIWFKNFNDLLDSSFLYTWMCSSFGYQSMQNIAIGSAQKALTISALKDLSLIVPPIDIQHHIATILSRYDSLIENYQKQIKLLEEAAQRLYKEWFVDFHFPGHETTKIVDGVPEGWEKKKISDICQTVGGGTPSTKVAEYYDDGNIKWVTPTDITRSNCLCLFDTDKKITEDGLAHSSAKILPPETILMTSRASVGYFGIYDCEVCTNQGFISCIPNERSYQMYMLYNLMNRVEEIRQKAGGSTYLEISKSVFRDFDIVLPSCMVLETFQEQSHKMLDCMRQIAKQLRLLTEARDRLLPKLMNCEINV